MADPTQVAFDLAFPEFKNSNSDVKAAAWAAAVSDVDAEVWGPYYAQGVYMRTAWLISDAIHGHTVRLGKDPVPSTYQREFERYQRIVTVGMRVFP